MNSQEILQLVQAGYTKEEIQQMTGQPEPQPDPQPDPQQEPQPEPQQDPQPEPQPELAALRQQLSETQQQLQSLVKQMQQNNLRTASVNILPADELERKTDEAMAELIRPKFEGGEQK